MAKEKNMYTKKDIIVEDSDGNILYPDNIIAKANQIITGKYQSSPMVQKVFNYALTKVKYDETEKRPVAIIKDDELREYLGIEHRSFYSQLTKIAKSLQRNEIIMKDKDTDVFACMILIPYAVHTKKRELKLYYEPKATKFILNLKTDFTRLDIEVYKELKTIYAMRLYEIFKSHLFKAKLIVLCYNVNELKFNIGMIKTNEEINDAICSKRMTIQEAINANIVKPSDIAYKDTWSFTNVMNNTINEINDTTDIWAECEYIKKGQGGKLQEVKFTVTDKADLKNINISQEDLKPKIEDKKLSENEILEKLIELKMSIQENLDIEDFKQLLEYADYKTDVILDKYRIAQASGNVKDIVRWLKSAIKEDYKAPIPVNKEKSETNKAKNKFNDFNQRDYTKEELDEIEKKCLAK